MTDQPTKVSLIVGGMEYTAFTRVTVTYAANKASRAFAVTVSDASRGGGFDQWNFMPGTPVTVLANGQLLLTGYINTMTPSFDAENHTVEISGTSKGSDSVKSGAEHEKGEFRDKTPLQVAQELDKQGVGFRTDIEQKKVEYFRLNPNETVFQAVERMVRRQPMLLQGMEDGSIKLTKGGKGGSNAPIIEGINCLGGSATFDDTNQHSEYKVRGQRVLGVDKKSLRIEAKEKDDKVKRHLPAIVHQETDIDEETAEKRAKHQKNRQSGEAITASLKLQSWFDGSGQLWIANGLVYCNVPTLKLTRQMLIKQVQLQQEADGGTTATVSLVLPQAFDGEGNESGGSGGGANNPWS